MPVRVSCPFLDWIVFWVLSKTMEHFMSLHALLSRGHANLHSPSHPHFSTRAAETSTALNVIISTSGSWSTISLLFFYLPFLTYMCLFLPLRNYLKISQCSAVTYQLGFLTMCFVCALF